MKPAESAKKIREKLKATFPHAKFRITSESNNCSEVSVEWAGSPTRAEMDAAIVEMPAETFASLDFVFFKWQIDAMNSGKWFGRTARMKERHEGKR